MIRYLDNKILIILIIWDKELCFYYVENLLIECLLFINILFLYIDLD